MPPRPDATNTIKVDCRFTDANNPRGLANLLYVGYSGTPLTQTELENFAAVHEPMINDLITTFMSSDCALAEVVYTDLTTVSSPRTTLNPGHSGDGTGDRAPSSAAAVISWNIARRYKGGHPRTYIGGLNVSKIVEPYRLNSTFRGNLTTAANAYIAAVQGITTIAGHDFFPVMVSYFAAGVERSTPLIDPLLSAAVHQRLDTQRRRLGKETP